MRELFDKILEKLDLSLEDWLFLLLVIMLIGIGNIHILNNRIDQKNDHIDHLEHQLKNRQEYYDRQVRNYERQLKDLEKK